MTLYQYIKQQLARQDPDPALVHTVNVQSHADGRISFTIEAEDRESPVAEFWLSDAGTFEKIEPMSETATFLTHPKPWRDAQIANLPKPFSPIPPAA